MNRTVRFLVGGAAVLAALLLLVLAAAIRGSSAALAAGSRAPRFELTTFDGAHTALEDLHGRVVVVNFWASWCVECGVEAAALEGIWRDYKDRGVTVLGIAYTDTRPAALAYLEHHGVTYPNGPDAGGKISRAYRLTGVPETVVIDATGRLAALPLLGAPDGGAKLIGPIVEGGSLSDGALRALLDRMTTDKPSDG